MKIFGIALFALVLQAGAQQPNLGQFKVSSPAAKRNAALAKATVDLLGPIWNSPLYTTRSNADGRFLLPNVAPGPIGFRPCGPNTLGRNTNSVFLGGPLELVVAPGQRLADIRLALIRECRFRARHRQGPTGGIADIVAMKPVYDDGQLTMVPVLTDRTTTSANTIFWFRRAVITSWRRLGYREPHPVLHHSGGEDDGFSFYTERRAARAVLNRAIGSGAANNECTCPIYFPGTPDPERASIVEVKPGQRFRISIFRPTRSSPGAFAAESRAWRP